MTFDDKLRLIAMITRKLFVVIFITLLLTCAISRAHDNQSKRAEAALVGDWHGESVCVVKSSNCHDEASLYHFSTIAGRPGWFSMKGDKIVDGKPITMGTVECSYQAANQSLTCSLEHDSLHFTVHNDQMTGVMEVEDGTVWRKISLKKTRLPDTLYRKPD